MQVSSRKVLQAVLDRQQVPADLFGPVCVVVDKIDKIGADKVLCRAACDQRVLLSNLPCYTGNNTPAG